MVKVRHYIKINCELWKNYEKIVAFCWSRLYLLIKDGRSFEHKVRKKYSLFYILYSVHYDYC
jgi:hypothetical protein